MQYALKKQYCSCKLNNIRQHFFTRDLVTCIAAVYGYTALCAAVGNGDTITATSKSLIFSMA